MKCLCWWALFLKRAIVGFKFNPYVSVIQSESCVRAVNGSITGGDLAVWTAFIAGGSAVIAGIVSSLLLAMLSLNDLAN